MKLPYIYSVIQKEQLKEILEAFYECIGLPIQVIDASGTILEIYGESTVFCSIFSKYLPSSASCEKQHVNASKRAVDIGEAYIFSCHSNLNHIVFPLINNESFLGSVIVGPFLMDAPDSLLIQDIDKRYHLPTGTLIELYEEASKIKVIAPSKVTQISRLLFYLFINLVKEGKQQLIINQEKLHQQSKINESIQMYKGIETQTGSNYPYEKEKELIQKVKEGNVSDAKRILNDLLGYVLFSEGNSMDIIKTRAFELCSLLSRAAMEGGAASDSILKVNNQFIKNIQTINDINTLCYKLQETVEVFTESMFYYIPSKNYKTMKRAMQYISTHFSEHMTLEEVASHVNLNPAYFSSLFKQSSGSSFKEYLNMVRVEESKRLLMNTDFSIIDIAIATGFSDQSYFSKTFKKYTGLSPKQYRK